ncbi:unnamed protein product [Acanthoscelides obtectus]|uniref:Uncharacterized protein n=1 Tax=Acanthoscelides obtectus TaxID=200917 RepID=A0A9P0ML05_ACAOB|nr:unnamed protein product [Acanthoscelides obtectus]CAK1634588.1 hypothetical protein AOBTE_LOCUS8818 [Acanthoscelides obtectus]
MGKNASKLKKKSSINTCLITMMICPGPASVPSPCAPASTASNIMPRPSSPKTAFQLRPTVRRLPGIGANTRISTYGCATLNWRSTRRRSRSSLE